MVNYNGKKEEALPSCHELSPGDGGDVVPGEDTRGAGPQRGALEPAVLALLRHAVHLPLPQLQLIGLLGLVGIEGQVAAPEDTLLAPCLPWLENYKGS